MAERKGMVWLFKLDHVAEDANDGRKVAEIEEVPGSAYKSNCRFGVCVRPNSLRGISVACQDVADQAGRLFGERQEGAGLARGREVQAGEEEACLH